ncbi:MAG: hypothetical protein LW636_10690 [Planctomycetaceae bacterium]|nr:hypothetical protein [Planctomycetaceae bacterium]
MNSPEIVPIVARPAAMRRPVTIEGTAPGSASFHQVAKRPAPSTAKSSPSPSSRARRPCSVFAITGKTEMIAALATIAGRP